MSANLLQAKQESTRVTLIGMVLDIVLGLSKIIGGLLTQSFALITDGIHSLTDAITDVFVLVMARIAHTEPDREHPYGHGRFETLGTIAMGVVFFITAGILLFDSYQRLRSIESLPVPGAWGIAIALFSIASKEWIYHYTMRVARRIKSNLLKANAWHSRSDAISSIAVLVGLIGAQQGYVWMDTVAAIFVALIIAKIGWELCVDSLRELVDTAVPEARREQLCQCIRSVEGIHDITTLRSRLSGGRIILEVQLLVDPRISVSEGHQLGESVRRKLIGQFSDIGDVLVHVDPETHDPSEPVADSRRQLPERGEVLAAIRQHWQSVLNDADIDRVNLHYLEHGIEVELVVRLEEVSPELASRLEQAISDLDYLAGLRIYHTLYQTSLHPPLSS